MNHEKRGAAAKLACVALTLLLCLSATLPLSRKRSKRIPNAPADSTTPTKTAFAESSPDSSIFPPAEQEMSEPSPHDERGAFLNCLWESIAQFEDGGGYDTARERSPGFSQSVWEGIDSAFVLNPDGPPTLNLALARPSFCSSACYLALMNALCIWDGGEGRISPAAWANLKPYVLREGGAWPYQDDGMGCWGRANANGPGFALLAARLGAGVSGYINADGAGWEETEPGDFLKLFWNLKIGADNGTKNFESGHLVILLERKPSWDADGERDDILHYWSSNGRGAMPEGGYGVSSCRISDVRRAVWTRITNPEAFNRAAEIAPDNRDIWLSALDGRHLASEEELLAALAGETMRPWLDGTSFYQSQGGT